MMVAVVDESIYIVKDAVACVAAVFVERIEQCAVVHRCLENTFRTVCDAAQRALGP